LYVSSMADTAGISPIAAANASSPAIESLNERDPGAPGEH
jgi:hypothetical protein